MRWQQPKLGDQRVVKRFLLCPLTLKGQTRWLEMALIRQQLCEVRCSRIWINMEWAIP